MCLGRIDNQVKLRGYRIELEEIEARVKSVAGVEKAVVVVDQTGERLHAYLVATAPYQDDPSGLRGTVSDYLTVELPDYVAVSPFGSLGREQAKAELTQLMIGAGLVSQDKGTRRVKNILEIYNIQEKISVDYRASQSIVGPLTLLYSKESFSEEALAKVQISHDKLSRKGFSSYPVEGTHFSMLRPKYVHSIARSVRDLIHANS